MDRPLWVFAHNMEKLVEFIDELLERTNNSVLFAIFLGFLIGYVAGFVSAYALLYWIGQIIVGWIKMIRG